MNEDPQIEQSVATWNRKGALEEITSLKEIRAASWEQHSHSYKWLTASLLAVNGGACLAVLGQADMSVEYKLFAAGCFVGGIVLAMLVAVLAQRTITSSLAPLQRQVGYWMTVVHDGVRDQDFEQTLVEETKNAVRLSIFGQVVGWASAAAFLGGITAAGIGIWNTETASARFELKIGPKGK